MYLIFNLQIKEELLKAEMEKFGTVTLVNLPKKADGKPKGFGFIVFDKLNDAKKAIDTLNERKEKFMGTKVACDWCIPKNIFIKNTEEVKAEVDVMDTADAVDDDSGSESDKSNDDSENEDDEKNREDSEKSDDDENKPKKSAKRKAEPVEKPVDKFLKKRESGTQDVQEQRTVFIRNLSYDTTAEAIQEAFTFFGPIKYVKLCVDRDLERPKGKNF